MVELDEYSNQFARALFAAFPEWRQFVVAEAPELTWENTEGSLIVKVPSPVKVVLPESGNWLLIDTCDGEVTISYDFYHTHFDCFSDERGKGDFNEAIAFLEDFIREVVFIAVLMDGDVYRGSTILKTGEQVDFTHFVRPFNRLYIRSWKGSHDRTQNFG